MNQPIHRHVIALVVLVILLGIVSFGSKNKYINPKGLPQDVALSVPGQLVPPPPLTESMRAVLDKSDGFVVAISYTDAGFEPADTSIRLGQSVRFTNNSSHKMWVSAVSKLGSIYPSNTDSCGQSEFDTCVELEPYEFWEFTFKKGGVWAYRNNSEESDVGIIRVK